MTESDTAGADEKDDLSTFSKVVRDIGITISSLMLCAGLFLHIYLCAKRRRGELQVFITTILFMMHLKDALSVLLFAETSPGSNIFDQVACTSWVIEHPEYFLIYNIWLVLFVCLNWIFVYQYLKVAAIAPVAFDAEKALSVTASAEMSKSLSNLKWVNIFFLVVVAISLILTQVFRTGVSIGIYDLPWLILTGSMIFAIIRMKRVFKSLD